MEAWPRSKVYRTSRMLRASWPARSHAETARSRMRNWPPVIHRGMVPSDPVSAAPARPCLKIRMLHDQTHSLISATDAPAKCSQSADCLRRTTLRYERIDSQDRTASWQRSRRRQKALLSFKGPFGGIGPHLSPSIYKRILGSGKMTSNLGFWKAAGFRIVSDDLVGDRRG